MAVSHRSSTSLRRESPRARSARSNRNSSIGFIAAQSAVNSTSLKCSPQIATNGSIGIAGNGGNETSRIVERETISAAGTVNGSPRSG